MFEIIVGTYEQYLLGYKVQDTENVNMLQIVYFYSKFCIGYVSLLLINL